MIAYVDSSSILRYIINRDASINHAFSAGRVGSSILLEIECRRVLHRYRMNGDLSDSDYEACVYLLDSTLASITLAPMSPAIEKVAMAAFPFAVTTLDAIHLATALVLRDREPDETILVFSHDIGMNRCARVLGFGVPLAADPFFPH
ncbi:MAG: PIN domain-containing protein [Spirochaetota bacterium]